MATKAMRADYHGEVRDSKDKFGRNILVYIGWDYHLMFCASRAFPLPPDMPFGAIVSDVIPEAFSIHPEFDQIDWDKVQWKLNGEDFTPDPDAPIEAQGLGHKSLLRFVTPELQGYVGAHI